MKKRDQLIAASLNNELRAGASATAPIPHVPPMTDREKLGQLVQNLNAEQGRNWGTDWAAQKSGQTESFKRAHTAAYEVPKTLGMQMPSAPQQEAPGVEATAGQPVSPVSLKTPHLPGSNPNTRHPGKFIHTTIELMHLLGEHAGNNQEIIKQNVNR